MPACGEMRWAKEGQPLLGGAAGVAINASRRLPAELAVEHRPPMIYVGHVVLWLLKPEGAALTDSGKEVSCAHPVGAPASS